MYQIYNSWQEEERRRESGEAERGCPRPHQGAPSGDPGHLLVRVLADLQGSLRAHNSRSQAGAAPQVNLQPGPDEVRSEHGQLEAEDGSLEAD